MNDTQRITRESLVRKTEEDLRNRARNIWHVGYTEGLLPLP